MARGAASDYSLLSTEEIAHLNGAEIENVPSLLPIQFSIIYISTISINVQVPATI